MSHAAIGPGARVIVRADFDVGLVNGRVEDDTRIRAHEETLRSLMASGARIRLVSHRGRPGGKIDSALSLVPVGGVLQRRLRRRVRLIADPFSREARTRFDSTDDMLLFENIRFWPGEEKNSQSFAGRLATWGDFYINEAFANCHRPHASMVALARMMPSYAGLHLSHEIAALGRVIRHPHRPLAAVLGGAKIETKLPLIRRFLTDADAVLVGGALANTIFFVKGMKIGRSLADTDITVPPRLFARKNLYLPTDVIVTSSLQSPADYEIKDIGGVRPDQYIVDIGPATRRAFADIIHASKTVVWNGPMGLTEVSACGAGTRAVAEALLKSRAFSVVGGGDTLASLRRLHRRAGFSHISTGGGAMLEFLSGKILPAIKVLER
ncbi:MAG: phosphoglycerate kinase [Candidatus Sungbacteria bacterium]|uniref:Phosphoglycerate kinase n=1 Tax=Candidatus Sungiibacteriota bacterium TaxID=2750080 RepID=A0A932VR01_9BACT|nr:phosphoglycerate kinase [Candidatus Sungbacteria bacterium]